MHPRLVISFSCVNDSCLLLQLDCEEYEGGTFGMCGNNDYDPLNDNKEIGYEESKAGHKTADGLANYWLEFMKETPREVRLLTWFNSNVVASN